MENYKFGEEGEVFNRRGGHERRNKSAQVSPFWRKHMRRTVQEHDLFRYMHRD